MTPILTRHSVRIGARQIHFRRAGRGPAVILLHASPRSSASLEPLMRAAPDNLSLFAFDTPGFGGSDALAPDSTIDDFAEALARTLDALGLRRVGVYGTHTGAAIAAVFAMRHPTRVARLVLDGISTFDAAERADLLDGYLPPFVPQTDGGHLAWLWTRLRDQALFFPWHRRTTATRLLRPVPDAEALHRAAIEWVSACDYRTAYAAAIRTDGAATVARLSVPALVGARADDVLEPHLDRLHTLPASVTVERFSVDSEAWAARIWQALSPHDAAPPAPEVVDPGLPTEGIGDTWLGEAGQRVHWRGSGCGSGRPLVLLHASPGNVETLDVDAFTPRGRRPVLALDLPGHGASDPAVDGSPAMMVDAVLRAFDAFGLDTADLAGIGAGTALAVSLRSRHPRRWQVAGDPAARGGEPAPPWLAPRPDGGHLFAAWQAARDDAIFGHWWSRDADARHDFGHALDVDAIHRAAIARLHDTPLAATWRDAMAR